MSTSFSGDSGDEQLPFGFSRKPVPDGLREENWKAVQSAIGQGEGAGRPAVVRSMRVWVRVLVAAARVLGLVAGIWYTVTKTGHVEMAVITTGYGEIKNVLLPDSSTVVLNANSTLRLPEHWTQRQGRQVWLDGEAYFQVKKGVAVGQKFVVHTRSLDVEVLGTRFNVNTRRQQSVVSLEEGKVRLLVHGAEKSVLEKAAPLIMRPGQVVTVNDDLQSRVNEDKDVLTHSGWVRHEFHFDNTSLGEVAKLIDDTYGYKMIFADSSMAGFAISGDLRVHNIQELVKVLEVMELPYGCRMYIREKAIYVTRH